VSQWTVEKLRDYYRAAAEAEGDGSGSLQDRFAVLYEETADKLSQLLELVMVTRQLLKVLHSIEGQDYTISDDAEDAQAEAELLLSQIK
jgi:hypothetical protein